MRIKWLAAPLALALVLGACGGDDDGNGAAEPDDTAPDTDDDDDDAPDDDGDAAPDPDADPVTLSFALFGGFGLEPLIEQYMEENPHITIQVQEADYGDHHDALVTALAAGSGAPDIAAVEVGYIGAFTTQTEAFHNLYDYGAGDIEDRYLDWKWEQAQNIDGDVVIGVPTDIGGMAICYRHDLFEAAGMETDREALGDIWGDSWSDFIAFGQEYVEASGAQGFVDNQNLLWNAVVNQDPNIYYDSDGNLIYEESEQLRYAWDTVIEAIDAGIIAEIAPWSGEWEAGMTDGTFAVLTCPAWMMGYIMEVAPDTEGSWDIARVPEGGGNWGGSHLTVPAQSEHPQEAFDFISWVMAPEQQLENFIRNGNFPSIPALFDDPAIQNFESEFFNGAPAGPIFADNAMEVVSQNIGPDYATIDAAFGDALARVIEGSEGADTAWESALEEVRREIS